MLAAIAFAAARGIESIVDDVKGTYGSKVADSTVKKAAKNKTSDDAPAMVKPGGTFSAKAAAPRTASAGTKTAAGIATGVQVGSTFWKSYLDGYREAWPTAREEAQKRQVERALRKQAEREARAAEKKATEAPTTAEPEVVVPPDAPAPVVETPGPPAAPPAEIPEPGAVPAKPALVLIKDSTPSPAPAPTGDAVTIPEVRTLDGLIHALGIVKGTSLMRAEEAAAIAADDAQLAAQLDVIEAQLAELEVDAGTLAEVGALRELITVQAVTAQQYGTAAQNAADLSSGAADAAYKHHGGINEAVQSSPIPAAAQAGYYNR